MEEMSILITNEAKRELDKLLENSDKTCIRILTRHITMTTEAKIDLELDEPNANDNCYDVDGYKVIINKVLDSQMNYITGNSCGACEVIKEKIEKFLENYPDIKAYEVNGEENTKIAYKYSVFSMPVFLLFIEGKESIRTGRHVDLLSLERSIDRYYNMIY